MKPSSTDFVAPFEVEASALTPAAAQLGGFLAAQGTPGARVGVLAGNDPAFIVARLAVTAAEQVMVPINPTLTAAEVAYVLGDAAPIALLCDQARAESAAGAVARLPAPIPVVSLAALPAAAPIPLRDAAGATLIYTSGTTGYPKGCLRSEVQEAARAAELTRTYGITGADVHLIACPLAHSAPGILLRAGLAAGARTLVMPRFEAESFLAAAADTGATLFFLVPTQYARILALPPETRARYDLSSVRAALVAGAPLMPELEADLIGWLGAGVLWQFYGSSETGTVTVLRPEDQPAHAGSVGRPAVGVELRLLDADGSPVATGEIGEVYVRSPTVMTGYRGATTDRPESRDGFITVGDLGRLDDDGFLYLVGRKHDTIISGGVNVYPAEVERALAAHPAVTAAVVFGVDHPDWGQIVAAAVATSAPTSADDLRAYLRAHLAAYKIPKAFTFVSPAELPVGPTGKPLRRR
ncbi:MAG TPA: AMP-binding protein [Kofleriaceae bacterium]|nr:AMP-binding protein [Kofleriaceae bacterium]